MVDIHTHILPGFDDGPSTVEQTRQMLAAAEQGGTKTLVLTPHILNPSDYGREPELLEKFALVQNLIRKDGRKIKIFLGGEIYLYPDTQLDRRFSTFNNNGKYALVEFSMREIPEFVPQKLFDLMLKGYQPVLAHPERYLPIMRNPAYAYKFAQMGVTLQMNAGSLLGVFGSTVQATAQQLLEHDLIHVIASDGHDTNSRTISLAAVRGYVVKNFGEKTADILLVTNPGNIIRGEKLLKKEPIPFDDSGKKTSRWQMVKKKLKLDKMF